MKPIVLTILEASFINGGIHSNGNAVRMEVPTTQQIDVTAEESYAARVVVERNGDVIKYRVFVNVATEGGAK